MQPETSAFVRNLLFFQGHLILAPIALFSSVWWTLNIFTNHHRERVSNGRHKFRSRLWYCGPFTQGLPLESVVKTSVFGFELFAQFVGCVLPQNSSSSSSSSCNFDTHAQHAVLYVSMVTAALAELMTHYQLFKLPEGVDRLANMIAYAAMTIVFVFHGQHSTPLSQLMHASFLPFLCVAVICALLLEAIDPTNFVVALVRPYAVTIIATWFLQLGYNLYPVFPWQMPLDDYATRNADNVPLFFCFHLMFTLVLFVALNAVVVLRLRRRRLRSAPSTSSMGAVDDDNDYRPLKRGSKQCTKCEKCRPLLMIDANGKSHLSE